MRLRGWAATGGGAKSRTPSSRSLRRVSAIWGHHLKLDVSELQYELLPLACGRQGCAAPPQLRNKRPRKGRHQGLLATELLEFVHEKFLAGPCQSPLGKKAGCIKSLRGRYCPKAGPAQLQVARIDADNRGVRHRRFEGHRFSWGPLEMDEAASTIPLICVAAL
jgi:hypothetical protein